MVLNKAYQELASRHHLGLTRLTEKGLCYLVKGKWAIRGKLLAIFVNEVKERSRGRIWYDETTGEFWQGSTRLELPPQHRIALHYFLQYARQPRTKSDLIMAIWPEEWGEIAEDRLYQLIRQLRQKIEVNPADPVHILNWRGKPEGGYQFFPEGRTVGNRKYLNE